MLVLSLLLSTSPSLQGGSWPAYAFNGGHYDKERLKTLVRKRAAQETESSKWPTVDHISIEFIKPNPKDSADNFSVFAHIRTEFGPSLVKGYQPLKVTAKIVVLDYEGKVIGSPYEVSSAADSRFTFVRKELTASQFIQPLPSWSKDQLYLLTGFLTRNPSHPPIGTVEKKVVDATNALSIPLSVFLNPGGGLALTAGTKWLEHLKDGATEWGIADVVETAPRSEVERLRRVGHDKWERRAANGQEALCAAYLQAKTLESKSLLTFSKTLVAAEYTRAASQPDPRVLRQALDECEKILPDSLKKISGSLTGTAGSGYSRSDLYALGLTLTNAENPYIKDVGARVSSVLSSHADTRNNGGLHPLSASATLRREALLPYRINEILTEACSDIAQAFEKNADSGRLDPLFNSVGANRRDLQKVSRDVGDTLALARLGQEVLKDGVSGEDLRRVLRYAEPYLSKLGVSDPTARIGGAAVLIGAALSDENPSASTALMVCCQVAHLFNANQNVIIAVKGGIVAAQVFAGDYMGAVSGLMSMMPKGPSNDEIILGQLQELSKQTLELRKEMHQRFDQVDRKLDILLGSVDRVEVEIQSTRTDIEKIRAIISTNYGQLRSDLDFVLQQIQSGNRENQLATFLKNYEASVQSGDPLTSDLYRDARADFVVLATELAANGSFSPDNGPLRWSLEEDVKAGRNIKAGFSSVSSILSEPLLSNRGINPDAYVTGAEAFLDVVARGAEIEERSVKTAASVDNQLERLIATGKGFLDACQILGRKDLSEKLLAMYYKAVGEVNAAIADRVQKFFAEKGLSSVPPDGRGLFYPVEWYEKPVEGSAANWLDNEGKSQLIVSNGLPAVILPKQPITGPPGSDTRLEGASSPFWNFVPPVVAMHSYLHPEQYKDQAVYSVGNNDRAQAIYTFTVMWRGSPLLEVVHLTPPHSFVSYSQIPFHWGQGGPSEAKESDNIRGTFRPKPEHPIQFDRGLLNRMRDEVASEVLAKTQSLRVELASSSKLRGEYESDLERKLEHLQRITASLEFCLTVGRPELVKASLELSKALYLPSPAPPSTARLARASDLAYLIESHVSEATLGKQFKFEYVLGTSKTELDSLVSKAFQTESSSGHQEVRETVQKLIVLRETRRKRRFSALFRSSYRGRSGQSKGLNLSTFVLVCPRIHHFYEKLGGRREGAIGSLCFASASSKTAQPQMVWEEGTGCGS